MKYADLTPGAYYYVKLHGEDFPCVWRYMGADLDGDRCFEDAGCHAYRNLSPVDIIREATPHESRLAGWEVAV